MSELAGDEHLPLTRGLSMLTLFEDPIPILMVGAVLLTFVGVWYYTTRHTGAFVALVVVAVLTLSGLVMEQIVYTDREMIAIAVEGITDKAEANDLDEVLLYIDPNATELRDLAKRLMPHLDIDRANVASDIEITLDDEKNATTATATFRAFFRGKFRGTKFARPPFVVNMKLVKDQKTQRWLVESFSTEEQLERKIDTLVE